MNTATFTFTSETGWINDIVSELLNNSEEYNKIQHMDNNGNPFIIEYEFTEEQDGKVVAVGGGCIDSEDSEKWENI